MTRKQSIYVEVCSMRSHEQSKPCHHRGMEIRRRNDSKSTHRLRQCPSIPALHAASHLSAIPSSSSPIHAPIIAPVLLGTHPSKRIVSPGLTWKYMIMFPWASCTVVWSPLPPPPPACDEWSMFCETREVGRRGRNKSK